MNGNSYFDRFLASVIYGDIEHVIEFLRRKGLLRSSLYCAFCPRQMVLVKCSSKKDQFRWKCMNKMCTNYKTTLSIRKGSPFEGVKSDLRKILHSIYLWSIETSLKQACILTGLAPSTMVPLYRSLRNFCKKHFEENPIRLGGPGIICQVDESLFSHKPKQHRGRASEEEKWVFGIVDTSFTPARGYMEYVERRNTETLLPIIERICLPGTIVVSDGWAAYPGIQERGYEFRSVNHRENFVDPMSGTHTQHVESYWNKQKLRIKRMKGMKKDHLEDYLCEFMWRDRFSGNEFETIIEHIRIYSVYGITFN
jgi:transposase-like protein